MIVLVNDRTNVIDGDGRRWKTKEPAVCYFFKNYWFNIICVLRKMCIRDRMISILFMDSLHLKKEKKVENQNEIAEQVGEKND